MTDSTANTMKPSMGRADINDSMANQSLHTLRPPAPSPLFTGRMKELELLHTFFRQEPDGEMLLLGVSGSGKTQLALRFAQVATSHCAVFYLDTVSSNHTLPRLFDEPHLLQGELELDTSVNSRNPGHDFDFHGSNTPANQSSQAGLVIFDGLVPPSFWNPEHCISSRRYMSRVLGYQKLSILYLLNNQQPVSGIQVKIRYLARGLDAEAAGTLLLKSIHLQYENCSPQDKETASQIAEHFGGFPVEILQVGAAIQRSGMTLQAYQNMSSPQQSGWIEKIGISLDFPWSSTYSKLHTSDQVLLKLLAFLPFYRPDPLEEILTRAQANLASYQPPILAKNEMERASTEISNLVARFTTGTSGSIRCSSDFNDAAVTLKHNFMFQFGGGGHGWRPGAYTWVKSIIDDQPFAEATAAYLLAVSIGPESELGSRCRTFRSRLSSLIDNMLLLYPDACAYHSQRFSLVYEARNRWKDAISLQKCILEKCRLDLGQTHVDTVSVSRSLASTYHRIGDWKAAKQLYSILLSHQEVELGESHTETISTMHDLALTLLCLKHRKDAESLQKRVCDGRRQALGATHPYTLSSMHSLALIYFEQGQWQEATKLHEQVLQTRRQKLGEHHPDTLSSMHSLATKHWEAMQSTLDAEQLNKQVLEARKKILGPWHPDTLSSMYALALVYGRQLQWKMATELAESVLETQQKVLGRDHVDTIETMDCLASWYYERSLPNAVALRTEILESRKAIYGEDSPETLASMSELVSTYWEQEQEQWAQAETLHLELLQARKRILGDNDSSCLETSLDLATQYLKQSRWQEASLIFTEVLAIKRQDRDLETSGTKAADIQQKLDLVMSALSLDVFVISSSVPIASVVEHFTRRVGLKDYTAQLQQAPDLPTEPVVWGGFSNIYKITLRDGRELAVKCLKSAHGEYKQIKQTVRELSSWSQLRYRSIAALLGLALFRGQLAMVSAWNHNGNVMKHIKEQPDVDRYVLCMQVVSAVAYLHQLDVVHGDLKGANILVTDDGSVQLTDFGLTIMRDAMIQLSKNTNQVGGTLRWMAPELVFGGEISSDSEHASQSMSENLIVVGEDEGDAETQPKLCKQTDIYALGMTMLEILTGKQPFKEIDKDAGVILALAQGKRPHRPTKILDGSPRGVPFWSILQRCWAQTPENRPDASDVNLLMSLLDS